MWHTELEERNGVSCVSKVERREMEKEYGHIIDAGEQDFIIFLVEFTEFM
jgi:hypothetical protein